MSDSTGSLTGRTLVSLFREEYDAMVNEIASLRAELAQANALRVGSYQPVEGKQAGILDSTLDVDYDRHMHLRLEIHARDGDSPSVIWLSNEYAVCRLVPGAAQVLPVEAVPQMPDEHVNLNYCQVCGKWLGMDDYDGICTECDVEVDESMPNPDWANAPEQAQWAAYSPRHTCWRYSVSEPKIVVGTWVSYDSMEQVWLGEQVELPLGVDYRQTLQARPVAQAQE